MFNFVQEIENHNFMVEKGFNGHALRVLKVILNKVSESSQKVIKVELEIPKYARSSFIRARCIYEESSEYFEIDVLGFGGEPLGYDEEKVERFLNELNFYIGSEKNKITRYGGVIEF